MTGRQQGVWEMLRMLMSRRVVGNESDRERRRLDEQELRELEASQTGVRQRRNDEPDEESR